MQSFWFAYIIQFETDPLSFFCAFLGERSIERWSVVSRARIEMSPQGVEGSAGALCIGTKLGNGPSALCSANTIYGGGRSGFVVYGHKETTAAQCEMPWGGWGVGRPPGGGETALNRASIALPQAVCGCLSCWALQSKILSAMKFWYLKVYDFKVLQIYFSFWSCSCLDQKLWWIEIAKSDSECEYWEQITTSFLLCRWLRKGGALFLKVQSVASLYPAFTGVTSEIHFICHYLF